MEELKGLIRQRYPDARFEVTRSPEDAEVVHLQTTVDLEDRDKVLDLVVERMMELQAKEGLPLYVIPVRPLERVLEELRHPGRKVRPALELGSVLPPITP
ncbi:MAG: hypothetical protein NTZ05_17855 [Chloroflexi bacterium]|nr:hypothetical protein [Chloroflexota bacterium]